MTMDAKRREHLAQILNDLVITSDLPDDKAEQALHLVSDVLAVIGGDMDHAELFRRAAKNFLLTEGWRIDGEYWRSPENKPEWSLGKGEYRYTWMGAIELYRKLIDDPAPYAHVGKMIEESVAARKREREGVNDLSKAELEGRLRPTSKRPCVMFNIGDNDHLAHDLHRDEWFFRVGKTDAFRGPFTSRRQAQTAWKSQKAGW